MSGIGGWSLGYQSAGPELLRICVSVNDIVLPGRCRRTPLSGPPRASESGLSAGGAPTAPSKPYAQAGRPVAISCCGGSALIVGAISRASTQAHFQFLIKTP